MTCKKKWAKVWFLQKRYSFVLTFMQYVPRNVPFSGEHVSWKMLNMCMYCNLYGCTCWPVSDSCYTLYLRTDQV